MVKSLTSTFLKNAIVRNVGCDTTDVYNEKVASVIHNWKVALGQTKHLVPMVYRNVADGTLDGVHDQILEVMRSVSM